MFLRTVQITESIHGYNVPRGRRNAFGSAMASRSTVCYTDPNGQHRLALCSHTLYRCKSWLDVLLRNRKSSMETGGARARVSMNMRHVGLVLAEGDPSRPSAPTILRSYLSTLPDQQYERPKSFDIDLNIVPQS